MIKPKGRLKLFDIVRDYVGVKSGIYIFTDSKKKKFLFKEINKNKIANELIAFKLGKLFGINVIESEFKEIGKKIGIIQPFKKYTKTKLNQTQIKQLQRVVLFDIWIGNLDRRPEDIIADKKIFLVNHDNIFNESDLGSKYLDYELGKMINLKFTDLVSNFILENSDSTIKEMLVNKLGFSPKYFLDLKKIKDKDIEKAVENKIMTKKDKKRIKEFLIYRKNNLEKFKFF